MQAGYDQPSDVNVVLRRVLYLGLALAGHSLPQDFTSPLLPPAGGGGVRIGREGRDNGPLGAASGGHVLHPKMATCVVVGAEGFHLLLWGRGFHHAFQVVQSVDESGRVEEHHLDHRVPIPSSEPEDLERVIGPGQLRLEGRVVV